MNTGILNRSGNDPNLRKPLIEIINAKIQFANFKLKAFVASLLQGGQKPNQPTTKEEVTSSISQHKVLDTIESSSMYTSKLLYLRANITEFNSGLIYQLISDNELETLSLEELKTKIK